jgi:hypothetical protein
MSNEMTAQFITLVSEKMTALFATLLLIAGLLVWGIVTHYCCGLQHRLRARREDSARNMSTML